MEELTEEYAEWLEKQGAYTEEEKMKKEGMTDKQLEEYED